MQRREWRGRRCGHPGADRGTIKRAAQDVREARHRSHEPTQRALGACGRRVNENAEAIGAPDARARERVDPFLQGTCRIAAVERDLRHQRVRKTVQEDQLTRDARELP